MHQSSLDIAREMLATYASELKAEELICDVGSRDAAGGIPGSYRPVVEGAGYRYLGVDIQPGVNVDQVVPEAGDWPSEIGCFRLVLCGQVLEHTKAPWEVMRRLASIVEPGGLLLAVAPFGWEFHYHPLDCWRILPDGMRILMERSGLDVIEVDSKPLEHSLKGDTWGIARRKT